MKSNWYRKLNYMNGLGVLEQFVLGFITGIGIVFIGMCGALLVALM